MSASPEPIIDAHHHIWRQSDLAWLQGEMQPRIFGPYRPIMRDYPLTEYLEDVRPHGIVGSVYVQANWPVGREVDEALWVQGVAASELSGFPQGIVAFADLASPDIGLILDALAAIPNVRGIRQQLHWHETPLYRFAPRPDVMLDADWRRGFALLEGRHFLFELQVFASQMADGAALARAFPGTAIVLEHAGMLEDRSPEGWAAWRTGMRDLASCPNVSTKLSGLGTFVHSASAELMAPVVRETIDIFGPDRCLFGSNFPIEKLWTSYGALVDAFRSAVADLSPTERAAILHDNARRAYRL